MNPTSIPGLTFSLANRGFEYVAAVMGVTKEVKAYVSIGYDTTGNSLDLLINFVEEKNASGQIGWAAVVAGSKVAWGASLESALAITLTYAGTAAVGVTLPLWATVSIGVGAAVISVALLDSKAADAGLKLLLSDPKQFAALGLETVQNVYRATAVVANDVIQSSTSYTYNAAKNTFQILAAPNAATNQTSYVTQFVDYMMSYVPKQGIGYWEDLNTLKRGIIYGPSYAATIIPDLTANVAKYGVVGKNAFVGTMTQTDAKGRMYLALTPEDKFYMRGPNQQLAVVDATALMGDPTLSKTVAMMEGLSATSGNLRSLRIEKDGAVVAAISTNAVQPLLTKTPVDLIFTLDNDGLWSGIQWFTNTTQPISGLLQSKLVDLGSLRNGATLQTSNNGLVDTRLFFSGNFNQWAADEGIKTFNAADIGQINKSATEIGFTVKQGATASGAGGPFSLVKALMDVDLRRNVVADFVTANVRKIANYYETDQGRAAWQSALVRVVVQLTQGANFNTVVATTVATLMATPKINELLDELFAGTGVAQADYGVYLKDALATVLVASIVNGGQNVGALAQNVSLQQAISYGVGQINNPVFFKGGMLTAPGAGLVAGVTSLAANILSGNGLNQQVIGQAAVAAGAAYASAALAGALVSTSLGTTLATLGVGAGPIGVAIGAVLGVAVQGLFKTKVTHDETISNSVELQADGSYRLTGLRAAGSLLRTTGTTNDDFIGNDSADDSAGHDVIVGQSGKNEIYARGGHDFVEGRANDDYIEAGTGDDHVEAGSGNDFVDGGAGRDRLLGQAGNDNLLGGAGEDTIIGGAGDDKIEGNQDDDELYGSEGNDTLAGGAGNDMLQGGVGNDVLTGELGNDQLDGGQGNDELRGDEGNDLLAGGADNDDLRGGAGHDVLLGESGVDVLYGGEGNDTLDGGLENDLAFGGIGNDTLQGNFGDDDLYGELGNDLLAGGRGDDLLAGGADNDVYVYAKGDGLDVIDDSEGLNTLKLLDLNAANLSSIARVGNALVLTFDALNSVTVKDHFVIPGLNTIEFANGQMINVPSMTYNATTGVGTYALVAGQNVLNVFGEQFSRYQQLMAPLSAGTALSSGWLTDNYDTRVLTDDYQRELYNDVQVRMSVSKGGFFGLKTKISYYDFFESTLRGSGYADRIVGMFWNETIDGAANNDQLYGNGGDDTVLGGTDHDLMFGGAGNDLLQAQGGNDKVFGGTGNDNIQGGEGNDTLFGESGDDRITADIGEDYVDGGMGNDTIFGGGGRDIIYGSAGADLLYGEDGDDFISDSAGINTLDGGDGNDLIVGGVDNDALIGGAGDDTILASGGFDRVEGGTGTDVVVLSGRLSDYTVTFAVDNSITIVDKRPGTPDGTLLLTMVERVQFSDRLLDTQGMFPQASSLTIPQSKVYNGRITLPTGFRISMAQAPGQGTVVVNSNGTFTYTAPAAFTGPTSFQYRLTSPEGVVQLAAMAVNVVQPVTPVGPFVPGNETIGSTFTPDGYSANWDIKYRFRSQVTKLNGGGYVVAWSNYLPADSNVFYQVFNAAGTAVTGMLQGNLNTAGNENHVGVVALSDGGFALNWTGWYANGQLYWRRFNAAGVAQTGDVAVLPAASSWNGIYTTQAQFGDGNLAVFFTGASVVGGDYQIMMRRFTPTGVALDAVPVVVNTLSAGMQMAPRATTLKNGHVVLVWEDWGGNDGAFYGVYAQIISAAGVKVGGELLVNTTTAVSQHMADVAALSNGGFVVVWSSSQEQNTYGIYGQRFDANGVKLGTEFHVNSYEAGQQLDSAVTALADGGYFVVWSSQAQDGNGYGVYGRRYDAAGNSSGSDVLINTTTLNDQMLPDVTELSNGDLMISWQSWHAGAPQVMQRRFVAPAQFVSLVGGEQSDILVGNNSADVLTGNGGDDTFDGSGGNDTLNGGAGVDVAQYSGNVANYAVTVENGTVLVVDNRAGAPDGTDTLTGVERLRYADQTVNLETLFPGYEDVLIPTNKVYSGRLTVPTGYTLSIVQNPGSGTLTLGTGGNYTYTPVSGYNGKTGFKFRLAAANGVARLAWINITVGADTLTGTGNREVLNGNANVNLLQGGAGDDFLRGEGGNDILDGGTGIDMARYTGNLANYAVTVNGGTVTVTDNRAGAPEGSDTLTNMERLAFADQTVNLETLFPVVRPITMSVNGVLRGKINVPTGYSIAVHTAPDKGTLSLSADGSYVYSAVNEATGAASFKYQLVAANGVRQIATVPVTIVPQPVGSGPFSLGAEVAGNTVSVDGYASNWDVKYRFRNIVTKLSNGGYVVAWSTYATTDANVYYQVYSAAGVAITGVVQGNMTSAGNDVYVSVTPLNDGGFALGWTGLYANGLGFWRVFNAAGVPQTADVSVLPVATTWNGFYATPAQFGDGTIAIFLMGATSVGGDYQIYMRRFNTAGTALDANPILVNSLSAGLQTAPRVTTLSNGNVVVVWEDWGGNDGNSYGTFAQIYASSGAKIGGEILVNTTIAYAQHMADVASLTDGGFVVVWGSGHELNGYGVYAQKFNASGTKVGSEIHVNSTRAGHQWDPAVTGLSDGGFYVVWSSQSQDGSGFGIYGQRYDQQGNTLGGEVQLNVATLNDQMMPDVTELANGDLMVSWQSWHSGTPQLMQRRLIAPVATGGSTLNGTANAEILVGGAMADRLSGAGGDDVLAGGAGNDMLLGGDGNDVYRFGIGDGMDTIDNQDAPGNDMVEFIGDVGTKDVWFVRSGYDLEVQLLGTTDKLKLQNWYVNDAQKVDKFRLNNGVMLDKTNVEQLVNAMAGFNPQAIGAVTALSSLPQSVQTTIAANWQ